MEAYDEDLRENPFFVKLLQLIPTLYDDAPHHQWTVCVPRLSSVTIEECLEDDFRCHILQPLDLNCPDLAYCTLNGKVVTIQGNVIMPKSDDINTMSVHILFNEMFYNSAKECFRMMCTEGPLQGNKNQILFQTLNSLPDCVGFLRQEISDLTVLHQIDGLFKRLSHSSKEQNTEVTLNQKNVALMLYEQALRIVYHDPDLKSKAQSDKVFRNNLQLAIETYIVHGLYAKLIQDLKDVHATDDAKLNRIIRNRHDLQPQDLGIGRHLLNVIPRAGRELAKITDHTTPLGKLCCLKRVIEYIGRDTSKENLSESKMAYTTEDIIPFLIYLILRSTIANWLAHLAFIKDYRLSATADSELGEHSFHAATLEAAIAHIKSDALNETKPTEVNENITMCVEESSVRDSFVPLFPKEEQVASGKLFFKLVRDGSTKEVIHMLEECERQVRLRAPVLCHPLCQCRKCAKQVQAILAADTSLLAMRDDRGRTALHIAVMCGHEDLTDALVSHKADVAAVDRSGATPLHLACLKGNQNSSFLLLHFGASQNSCDSEGNIPLHNTVANGHIYCAKLLLYYDEQMGLKIDVNCANRLGDTPLHVASTFGYNKIVELLLQFGAKVNLHNKARQSPLDCAHSTATAALLREGQHKVKTGVILRRRSTFQMPQRQLHGKNVPVVSACDNRERQSPSTPSPVQTPDNCGSFLEKSKVEKLLRAVEVGDVKLVSFYLGVNGDELEETEARLPKIMCHPLCQCDACIPVQEAAVRLHSCSKAAGVSVNCRAVTDGVTPLHVACLHGHLPLVALLLRCGASVDARDSHGRTPLHLAQQADKGQIVELLRRHEINEKQDDVLTDS